MALIKSALELALEKTEGLSVDKDELRRKELFTQGRVAAAKGLEEGPAFFAESLKTRSAELGKDEKQSFRSGAGENLVSRINLAFEIPALKDLEKVAALLDVLTSGKSGPIVESLSGLFQQYGQEVTQLRAAIAQQLGPQLRQRAQQQGANPAQYVLERDPAYLKVLAENLEPMRMEYQGHLDEAKAQLRALTN
ncbi:MAG: DUF6657 family protein [Spirochaetales bacterium]